MNFVKLQSKIAKFLSNKTVLNIVLGISFLNLIAFIMLNETIAIVYFILIGLVTSFFSKNMIIVLLVPLFLVNLFFANTNKWNFFNFKREGLENNTSNADTNNTTGVDNKPIVNAVKNAKQSKNTTTNNTTQQGLPITPLDHPQNLAATNTNESEVDESFEVGRSKKNSKGYNIDYASTVEDAYDELNKILGSDGIKRLTNDTQNLMKQQLQLAESMKSMQPIIAGMAPLMKQAEGLLGSMGDNGNLGNLASIAKKFSAGLGSNTSNPIASA
jgi:hypothetical protein